MYIIKHNTSRKIYSIIRYYAPSETVWHCTNRISLVKPRTTNLFRYCQCQSRVPNVPKFSTKDLSKSMRKNPFKFSMDRFWSLLTTKIRLHQFHSRDGHGPVSIKGLGCESMIRTFFSRRVRLYSSCVDTCAGDTMIPRIFSVLGCSAEVVAFTGARGAPV